jgi:hypothetical protein
VLRVLPRSHFNHFLSATTFDPPASTKNKKTQSKLYTKPFEACCATLFSAEESLIPALSATACVIVRPYRSWLAPAKVYPNTITLASSYHGVAFPIVRRSIPKPREHLYLQHCSGCNCEYCFDPCSCLKELKDTCLYTASAAGRLCYREWPTTGHRLWHFLISR